MVTNFCFGHMKGENREYSWVESRTVRVKCLAQEHNTVSHARARTQAARYGVEHTNHEDLHKERGMHAYLPCFVIRRP